MNEEIKPSEEIIVNQEVYTKQTTKWKYWVYPLVALVIAAGLIFWVWKSDKPKTQTNTYSMVTLDNGQVWFGKLNDNTLNDAYFPQSQPAGSSTQISLVKLSSGIQGGTGNLTLSSNHILYVEPLRDDSQFVQEINKQK